MGKKLFEDGFTKILINLIIASFSYSVFYVS